MTDHTLERDYESIARSLRPIGPTLTPPVMTPIVDALWDHLHTRGVSWVGFYIPDPDDASQMLLTARRDKPACSPIGMHGACGWSYLNNRAFVVTDVKHLGDDYVACDPKDRSEVVLPVIDEQGNAIGVLDLDSFDVGSFGSKDVEGLADVLRAGGLFVADDLVEHQRTV